MLMVEPAALRQSKPPVTASAPLGRLALPPTPHELSTGTLAAAAPATPRAASIFRRENCCPIGAFEYRLIRVLISGGDQGDLDRFLAAGDEVESLLELGQRQLVGADPIHRQHTGLDHLDRRGPAVGTQMRAEDVE